MGGNTGIDGLRAQARRAIVGNARALAGADKAPAQQWWNLTAKYEAGNRIAQEEKRRSLQEAPDRRPHNDIHDARRHARWSRRMATEIDPLFAGMVGGEHELEGLGEAFLKQGFLGMWKELPESMMDMRNNLEGIRAAREQREIRDVNLTPEPVTPSATGSGRVKPGRY